MFDQRLDLMLPQTTMEVFFEVVAFTALVTCWLTVIRNWKYLPKRIPIEFDLKGQVVRFGHRSWLIAGLLLFAFIYVGLTMLLPEIPFEVKSTVPITPENAERQFAIRRSGLLSIKALTLLMFAHLSRNQVQVSLGTASFIGRWKLRAWGLAQIANIILHLAAEASLK